MRLHPITRSTAIRDYGVHLHGKPRIGQIEWEAKKLISPRELARVVTACYTCVIPWATGRETWADRIVLEEADRASSLIDSMGVVVSIALGVNGRGMIWAWRNAWV